MKRIVLILMTLGFGFNVMFAQQIPKAYSNLYYGKDGHLYLKLGKKSFPEKTNRSFYTLKNMMGNPQGTKDGIAFDFNIPDFSGILYYGFINYHDSKHPLPVYFKKYARIQNGKASINISHDFAGKYDMVNWEETGLGTLGYRVVDAHGTILYDGKVSFKGKGPFTVIPTIVEGPFVNLLKPHGATLSFRTSSPVKASIKINGRWITDHSPTIQHEIKISGLKPDTNYPYTVKVGPIEQTYALHTAHKLGARKPFTFAYASDSREARGGGERNIWGTNAYIVKKVAALASQKNVAFIQFTGDLIDGYKTNILEADLQYANWKHAIEPFAHYFPFMVAMGNHEVIMYTFTDVQKNWYSIDRFPYKTQSAEAIFAKNFVNPLNGPVSEDGATYDPDPNTIDFPSYKENVFYYTYDNVAVVVMNSNYWYGPGVIKNPQIGGNPHAYIMDNQLKWVKATLQKLQNDPHIDHIFMTEHTPFFPNGGHVSNDMWYNGSNKPRPVIAGKPVDTGIIERRDQLLDIIVNKTPKIVGILTGDEHNYCRTEIGPDTPKYPDGWTGKKLQLKRTIWQINNGAAGAPYYAREKTPWYDFTHGFTTQNALVFFKVQGKKIKMEVYNPDTLELIDELELK